MRYPIVSYIESARVIRSYYRLVTTISNIPDFVKDGYRRVK